MRRQQRGLSYSSIVTSAEGSSQRPSRARTALGATKTMMFRRQTRAILSVHDGELEAINIGQAHISKHLSDKIRSIDRPTRPAAAARLVSSEPSWYPTNFSRKIPDELWHDSVLSEQYRKPVMSNQARESALTHQDSESKTQVCAVVFRARGTAVAVATGP